MATAITLPSALDLNAAAPLKADIQAHLGAPLDVDASHVERVGGLCLQVLLAASAAWRGAGLGFRVVNPSDPFREDVLLMGAASLMAVHDGGSDTPC